MIVVPFNEMRPEASSSVQAALAQQGALVFPFDVFRSAFTAGSDVASLAEAFVSRADALVLPDTWARDECASICRAAAMLHDVPVHVHNGDVQSLERFLRTRAAFSGWIRGRLGGIAGAVIRAGSADVSMTSAGESRIYTIRTTPHAAGSVKAE